jgi:hypothetical protein
MAARDDKLVSNVRMNDSDDDEAILQELLIMTKTKMKICSATGCKNKSRRRGLCQKHASPMSISVTTSESARVSATCIECGSPVRCKGLCSTHYFKMRKGKS